MQGVQFVTDSKGKKIAVQIDLEKYGSLWEDFQDALITFSRRKEPRRTLESVKKTLKKSGKLK